MVLREKKTELLEDEIIKKKIEAQRDLNLAMGTTVPNGLWFEDILLSKQAACPGLL